MQWYPADRRERFARAFVKHGVLADAVIEAGYKPGNRNLASRRGWDLMQNDKVKKRIQELQAAAYGSSDVTPELVIRMFTELAATADSPDVRHKAARSLGETLGMFKAPTKSTAQMDRSELFSALSQRVGKDLAVELFKSMGVQLTQAEMGESVTKGNKLEKPADATVAEKVSGESAEGGRGDEVGTGPSVSSQAPGQAESGDSESVH